jgi:hypothetical protein
MEEYIKEAPRVVSVPSEALVRVSTVLDSPINFPFYDLLICYRSFCFIVTSFIILNRHLEAKDFSEIGIMDLD